MESKVETIISLISKFQYAVLEKWLFVKIVEGLHAIYKFLSTMYGVNILAKIKIYLIKNTMSCTMSGRNDEIWRYNSCTTNHVSPIFCMMHCCCPRPYYFQVLIFIFSNFRKTNLNKFYATVTFSILFWPPMICCWDCISLLPVKNAKHAGRAKSLIIFKIFYIL